MDKHNVDSGISLTRVLKVRKKKEFTTQNSGVGDQEEDAIKELEEHGDIKKDVPVGGEEFESEEPRQG
jgi:hypothetical protein